MGIPGHEFLKDQGCCICGWRPKFRGPIHPEQQWSNHLREHKPQTNPALGLINYLAHEIWTRWHGPLAKIPGTHEETVSDLTDMFAEYEERG